MFHTSLSAGHRAARLVLLVLAALGPAPLVWFALVPPAVAKDGSSGHGGDHDDGDDDRGDNDDNRGDNDDRSGSNRSPSDDDLDHHYEDGFSERIVDGLYVLTDQHGRIVIKRRAQPADFTRLRH